MEPSSIYICTNYKLWQKEKIKTCLRSQLKTKSRQNVMRYLLYTWERGMVENEFPILYTLILRKSSSRCQTGRIKLKWINTHINKTFWLWGIRRQHGKKKKKKNNLSGLKKQRTKFWIMMEERKWEKNSRKERERESPQFRV